MRLANHVSNCVHLSCNGVNTASQRLTGLSQYCIQYVVAKLELRRLLAKFSCCFSPASRVLVLGRSVIRSDGYSDRQSRLSRMRDRHVVQAIRSVRSSGVCVGVADPSTNLKSPPNSDIIECQSEARSAVKSKAAFKLTLT